MRYSLALLLFAGLAGCGDFEEAMNSERQPVSPPGIAPIEDMSGHTLENPQPVNPQANGAPAQPPADPGPPTEASIPQVDAKMVDMKAAMAQNPNLVVVENKIEGSDPLSVTASAYVSLRSKPGLLAFQHNLNIWKATNDNRNPSFEEFQEMAKGLQFGPLRPYQMYGYDADKGGLVILEDKAQKKRHFEEKGIPYEE
jgi:hypothetical protein